MATIFDKYRNPDTYANIQASGQGQPETSSGGGFNYAGMIRAFSQAVPSIMNSVSQYNAPIGDNAQYLGDYYVNAKKTFNKNTGILGGLGLLTFTDDINQDLANLENDTAARISAMKAPEATSLDDAMGKLSAFRKQDFSIDNIYSNKYARGFKTALKGAELGTSISPGWGTLIGGVAGSLTGIIGAERNNKMYGMAASAASNALRDKQRHVLAALQNNVSTMNTKNMQQQKATISAYGGPLGVNLNPVNNALDYMQNEELLSYMTDDLDSRNKKSSLPMFAFGGALGGYGGDWSNGLTFVKAGGSHEKNPLGGVPMGMAQDGQPNLVEEGEVIWNHPILANGGYVFTKRHNIPKWLQDKYNLGKEPITYAAAVDKLQQAISERPNDPIEQKTLEAELAEFMGVQEEWRQKKEANDMVKYAANGGLIHIAKNKKGTFTAAAKKHGMGVQEFASKVLANKEDYSPAMIKKANFARNASKWHHALGGYLFYGGGYIDPVTGEWIETGNPMDDYRIQYPQARRPQSTIVAKPLAATPINQYVQPIYLEDNSPMNQYALATSPLAITSNSDLQQSSSVGSRIQTSTSSVAPTTPSTNDYRGATGNLPTSGWQTGLRYAPILGGAIGLAHTLFNKPDYEYANELSNLADTYANQVGRNRITPRFLGDRLTYNPFDRLFYANELGAQQAATNAAIRNQSNGNRGQAIASLLASGYNGNIGLGKLFREGEEYNLAQRQKVAEFNRGTNQYNSEADLKAQMFNNESRDKIADKVLAYKAKALEMKQADDQAYQAALMANLTNLFDNIGGLGEDYTNRYDRNALINAGVFGTLSQKPYGVSDADWEAYQRVVGQHAAYGGKLNRKKRRGLTI